MLTRIRSGCAALVTLALSFACARPDAVAPVAPPTPTARFDVSVAALPAVYLSEIHYDNTGTDADERIEINGPAGMNVTGWQIILYNGNGGASYNTVTLNGTIPACTTPATRGVLVVTYPVNGIQNGDPDGVALVNASGTVIEFLSYEGTFAATNGPASGTTSVDIGVREAGTEPLGQSLQRTSADAWNGPIAHTFGACNDDGSTPPPQQPPGELPATRLSELHYDNVGTDVLESVEIEGPAGTNLTGWSVVLYNGNGGASYDTRALSGTIPASCGARGVVLLSYPQDGVQNGSPDGVALVNAAGEVVEFLSYEGTFAATNGAASGKTSIDLGVSEAANTPIGQSLQRNATGTWLAPAASSFGGCNANGPIPVGNTITFTGRTSSDVPLPVGFQDQIFATVRDPNGTVIPLNVNWSTDTPAIASIDANGVFTALSAGSATFRATTVDGLATASYVLPTRVAVASATAQYVGNAEFGEPADGNPGDDFIVRYPQYTASYNVTRGTPNWVSYNLEATHFGPEDRCDCFTFDPTLPPAFPRYTTADYTGAGAFAGFGIDRGHLARSFDRTSASLDNAFTFYFTNIVPQTADLNQGPWAAMENFLGDLARLQNKEVYIVTGVAGNKGTVKGEGKIVIPAFTWKVAVIMPRNQGLANIDDLSDLEVIAAIMPNEPGIRNVNWETYKTTVDAVEAASGYDLLALLRDDIEIAVESNTKPPVAVVNGPFTSLPGESVAMSAAGSSDPDGDALTYLWSFGDGTTGTGLTVSHTYAQAGSFTVRLIVRDIRNLADTVFTTATVLTPAQATEIALDLLDALAEAGKVSAGNANSLRAKLRAAQKSLEADKATPAIGQLGAVLNEIEAMVRSGRLSEADAKPLHDLVDRIIASIT